MGSNKSRSHSASEPTGSCSEVMSSHVTVQREAGFAKGLPTTSQSSGGRVTTDSAFAAGLATAVDNRQNARPHGSRSDALPESGAMGAANARQAPSTRTYTKPRSR